MNQTARTFVFVGLVVSILLAMHLLPTIVVEDVELRHVNLLSDVLPEVYQQRDGIDVIPKPVPPKPARRRKNAAADSTAATVSADSSATVTGADEAQPSGLQANETNGDCLLADYSEGKPGGMGHFYERLATASDHVVRIAYYGDSFIEGDILTADLREMLQERFGGNGVGWVDCTDRLDGFRPTIRLKSRGFKAYEVVQKPYSHRAEGIAQRYFVPAADARCWATGTSSRKHAAQWQHSSLFVRTDSGMTVNTYADGDSIGLKHVDGSEHVQSIQLDRASMRSVGYRFSDLTERSFVYGMALEGTHGIVLDNLSMRGSAGYTIANIPSSTLNDFARLRPYDLIVLHFGLNVANEKSHAANYKAYIKRMEKAVRHLQAAFPQASILIVSMPDRDQRTDSGIRTMLGVESLVAYQQILASNCGVAYFNLFQAMGGRESMKALVDRGLGAKDYTHLTHAGGKRLARLFFEALMQDYNDYHHGQ